MSAGRGVMMEVHWKALGLAILTVLSVTGALALLAWAAIAAPKWVVPSLLVGTVFWAFTHLAYLIWRDSLR